MFNMWRKGEVAEGKAGSLVRIAEGQAVTYKITKKRNDMRLIDELPARYGTRWLYGQRRTEPDRQNGGKAQASRIYPRRGQPARGTARAVPAFTCQIGVRISSTSAPLTSETNRSSVRVFTARTDQTSEGSSANRPTDRYCSSAAECPGFLASISPTTAW